MLTVYSTSWCPHCKKAIRFLMENHVDFVYKDIEKQPDDVVQPVIEANGGRGWVVKPTAKQIKKFFKPGKWNEMTVSARGRHIVVHVNGQQTAELKDDPGRLEGHLALQLHGGQDMHVEFKDIEIRVEP